MKRILILLLTVIFFSCSKQDKVVKKDLSYEESLTKAKGSTVRFYMWGGSATINKWVDEYVGGELKKLYDINLVRVPMDASIFVNKLITEKQAGKDVGNIDLVWINGENFKNAHQAGLLQDSYAQKLPNVQKYVDPATIAFDFGYPVNNMESPYGRAQFVFEYDEAKLGSAPKNITELKKWIMANPSRFTYPSPPDFTGSAFIRQMLYAVTGGHEQYLNGFNEAVYQEKSKLLWDFFKEIKPYLWQKGESYPKDIAALDLLFERGEIDFGMSYHQAHAQSKILDGKYPKTVKSFVLEEGSIFNTHFTSIPFNAPNVAGALIVSNFLISPAAQYSKNLPENWGDFTILDTNKLSAEDKSKFTNIDLGSATLPLAILNKYAVPEIPSSYLEVLEKDWKREVLGKK